MNSIAHLRRWIVPLALTPLVLVVLGVWAGRPIRQPTAVNGIDDAQYVGEWLAEQKAGLRSGKQSEVYFYDSRGTDALLQEFADNSAIESLTFELTDLSDAGVTTIAKLPNIKRLTLYGGMPRVGDLGLGYLRGQPSLTTLKLINVDVTDVGLEVLRTLPRVRHLTLYREGFREKLLTNKAVDVLRTLTGLRTLNVAGGWMSQSEINNLRASLPECKILNDENWYHDAEQSDARETSAASVLNTKSTPRSP